MRVSTVAARLALLTVSAAFPAVPALAADEPAVLPPLQNILTLTSTVPGNGDVNPYGMAQVKRSTGNLVAGNILISNFNNSNNLQGTGTTIVEVAPDGTLSLFASIDAGSLPGACPGGVGLTTALVVLESGWVIVGSLPTADGTSATALPGCLIVLDSMGNVVETFSGSLINGPWDMTAFDGERHAKLFVTNVLNGTVAAAGTVVNGGTVTRLNLEVSDYTMPQLESITVIGSGFAERTDPNALVIGPTGVGLRAHCASDRDDCGERGSDHDGSRLYVADTLNNRVVAIDNPLERTSSAGTGHTLSAGGGLNGPLGLIVTPGGEVLTVNGGDGFITEITPEGRQVARFQLDASGSPPAVPGSGALFGLVFDPRHGVYFVDDATNTLNLLHH
jgi:DNA-binding beta-propeller fold protein YncE